LRKEAVFTFKLSNMDRDALFATAAAHQQTPSEFLRGLLQQEARKLKLWNPTPGQLAGLKGEKMAVNKKPAYRERAGEIGQSCMDTPILPQNRLNDNPHIKDLRRLAETLMEAAEASQDWPAYKRHYRVYLALVKAEFVGGEK